MTKRIIAVDIGASSGKMAYGIFDGDKLSVVKYRDFINRPVDIGTALYWDVFGLYHSIIDGMSYFCEEYGEADTLAIDTWGASYGLLDRKGRLLEPVYHYRDIRTDNILADMEQIVDFRELFALTGCQCNATYTLPQLYSYIREKSNVLQNAEHMLLLPDLLGYFLSGEISSEMTIAGTSCLMENRQEAWSYEVAKRFSIPFSIYTDIIEPGEFKGTFLKQVAAETGMRKTRLAAAVSHDSAAAVAAIPDFGKNALYISVGTNISMGIERDSCLLTEEAYQRGFKNTGGINRKKIIYRDFSAGWHLNEFMRTKRGQGIIYTHPDLIGLALDERKGVHSLFDVEAKAFNEAGGDFCEKMNRYFEKTGQRQPDSDGEFVCSIIESIALKAAHYARAFEEIGEIFEKVYVINGGSRNQVLMQALSNALDKEIMAGMSYATLYGNLLTQLYALGEVKDVKEMRELSCRSFEMERYEPKEQGYWQEARERYQKVLEIQKNL